MTDRITTVFVFNDCGDTTLYGLTLKDEAVSLLFDAPDNE